jgi:chemotaxis response regulator CheB
MNPPLQIVLVSPDKGLSQQIREALAGISVLPPLPPTYTDVQSLCLDLAAKPDMILLDLGNGKITDLVRRCRRKFPVAHVTALLESDAAEDKKRWLEAGAHAVLSRRSVSLGNHLTTLIISALFRKKQLGHCRPDPLSQSTLGETKALSMSSSGTGMKVLNTKLRLNAPVEIIAIAISTGGPQALMQLVPELPRDFPIPIVVVQHIPANFVDSLVSSLRAKAQLQIQVAHDGLELLPGTLTLACGDHQLAIERQADGRPVCHLSNDPPENFCRPSADFTFRSLGPSFGASTLAVIMTGMGADGAKSAKVLREKFGCTVLGQDKESCTVFGMPAEADKIGAIDRFLPLNQMAGTLQELVAEKRRAT